MTDQPPEIRRRRRRSSASTALDTLLTTAKEAEATIAHTLHVLWDDLPAWRRDNVYITTGYRPTSNSYRRSLTSLGYVHNETVNIYTHLLAALLFTLAGLTLHLLIAPRYATAAGADIVVFGCFFGGAFLCLGMSATYHLLSNHSESVAKWGNKLDYSGIVFLIVGSFVPTLYYGLYCLRGAMVVYLYMISILGVGTLAVSWLEHFRTPEWRPYRAAMFACLGLSGVVPVVHGLTVYSWREMHARMGLGWTVVQGVLYILGAFIYAMRWPERRFPRRFDIWGSSHQIFHVCVVLAAAAHLLGLTRAFDYHHSVMGAKC